jgi:phosphatidylserine/phosphatidylglycerophosphate/cardiolipin synthase-like enzyme
MIAAKSPIPVLPATAHPTPVVGGAAVLAASSAIADAATQTLHVDTFRPTRPANLASFSNAAGRGVDVQFLLDTENLDAPKVAEGSRAALAGVGHVREFGTAPFKQHGKAISRDGIEAMVASDVSDAQSEQRLEFGVRFAGPAAAALATVQAVAPDADAATANAAYDAARATGIVTNDPHHARHDVTHAVNALIKHADHQLVVVTKLFDSSDTVDRLLDAAQHGARTSLYTHELPKRQAKQLDKAGVDVHVVDHDVVGLHGTLVASDGTVLLSSVPLLDRALVGNKHRQSRELGVAIDGAPAAALVDEVLHGLRA